MKPEWCPQDVWDAASGYVVYTADVAVNEAQQENLARALLDAHQRGKEEGRAIGRREGMEEAALYLDKNSAGGAWVHAIRAKAQEVKP